MPMPKGGTPAMQAANAAAGVNNGMQGALQGATGMNQGVQMANLSGLMQPPGGGVPLQGGGQQQQQGGNALQQIGAAPPMGAEGVLPPTPTPMQPQANGLGMVIQKPPSAAEVLKQFAEAADEKNELSLKTLKKKELDKIMKAVETGRSIANNYYTDTVEPKIKHRIDAFLADRNMYKKKFAELSEFSNWVSRDIKTVVDWIKPSLIDAFTGGDDPVDVKGVSADDDLAARRVQQLLKYQLQRKNNYFSFLAATLSDALKVNMGVAKVHWVREEKRTPYKMFWAADAPEAMQVFDMINQAAMQGALEITEVKDIGEGVNPYYEIHYDEIEVKKNQPCIEYLPPSELRFTPEGKNLQECKFVAHRKVVQGDYLKRKEREGIYRNVDKAIEEAGDTRPTASEVEHNNELDDIRSRLGDSDKATKQVELYECYLDVDYNNDGELESLIVHCVGDVPLSVQKNEFGCAPFFIAQAEYDPAMVFPEEGFTDGLEQLQDLKTALVRQVIIAVAKNNVPQRFVNSSVDYDAMLMNDEVILVSGTESPAQSVFVPPSIPIAGETMQLVQYAQNEIESQSGSTRYNQGMDSSSLNKTATGITAILGQADKRIRLMARQLAENFVIPIFKYIIRLNERYAEPEQMVRLTNEELVVRREDFDIDYDFVVNVGDGAGTREAQMQFLMVLIQQLYPVLEQKGLIDTTSWHSIFKELLEKMGLKNTQNYVIDPNSEEGKLRLAAMAQKMSEAATQQQQAELAKMNLEVEKARTPRLSVRYDDLAPTSKLKLLKAYNLEAPIEEIREQEKIINHNDWDR